MNEIRRPASIRELLDNLARPTLIYLCEFRDLPVSRANDDCRSSIARSFRGQRDEFLATLRKEELVLLLQQSMRDGDAIFELPNPRQYGKRELQELATLAFGRSGGLGPPFISRRGTAAPRPAQGEPPAETAPDDPLMGPVSTPAGLRSAGGGWSRPRSARTFFEPLGFATPTEMTQENFSALVEALELRGYEVATSEGVRLTPLHDAVAIDAELRVRHDALAAAPASLRTAAGTREEVGGPPPVELGDYERASLRLELLTAGVPLDGVSEELIAACVEVSAAGLPIQDSSRRLLERVAKVLAQAQREPIAVLTALARRLDVEDGEVLLREYAALHRQEPEVCALLSEHWAALHASSVPSSDLGAVPAQQEDQP